MTTFDSQNGTNRFGLMLFKLMNAPSASSAHDGRHFSDFS